MTKIKSMAKKQYYAKELEANTGNPRKTWKGSALYSRGNSKKSSALPSVTDLNDSKVTDQQIILREIRQFFFAHWKKN